MTKENKMNENDAEMFLLESMLFGSTGKAIENQEKRGQTDFVFSDTMPIKGDWDALELMGFVRGDSVDDIFVEAKLPDGWKKEASNHSMWSYIHDDKGRERVSIFYKAAFYDRSAHFGVSRRYSYGMRPVTGWDNDYNDDTPFVGAVTDYGKVIFQTETATQRKNYDEQDKLEKEALDWLNENYPDWKNPAAYWD